MVIGLALPACTSPPGTGSPPEPPFPSFDAALLSAPDPTMGAIPIVTDPDPTGSLPPSTTTGTFDGGDPFDGAPSTAGSPDDGADATPEGACGRSPGPGDLAIDELMIEAVAGTGDYGEWLEAASTVPCALNLRELHGECPHGAKIATFDISDDMWLAPGATFVVADTSFDALNHHLPAPILTWAGQRGDILGNKGATVTLEWGGSIVDSVTYPALTLTVGASIAFPSDCPPALRSDWTQWQTSTQSWFPGFEGTPNAPNTDVTCP
jgi:hypothetical protein